MHPKLKWAIENTENPKILKILTEIAQLKSEEAQGKMLELIESGAFSG